MRRWTIFALVAVAGAAVAGVAAIRLGESFAVDHPAPLPLSATALPLDRDDPAVRSVGRLVFLGALQLRSTNALFGGLSSLRWRGDASGANTEGDGWLLSVSDTGNWVMFRPVEHDARLVGVTGGRIAPVLMVDGKPAIDKEAGDAEALEWPADDNGTAAVFFEQDHRVQIYRGIDPDRPQSFAVPPAKVDRYSGTANWPANGGGEAFVQLDPSARLVFAETARGADGSNDVLLLSDRGNARLGYRPPDDFSPTDAVRLDAGHVLVLNRRFSAIGGIGTAIVLVDLSALNAARAAGKVPDGMVLPWTEVARWAPPLTLDNMEGLALRRVGDRVFLYVVSDDNLSGLQRTVLMKFELKL